VVENWKRFSFVENTNITSKFLNLAFFQASYYHPSSGGGIQSCIISIKILLHNPQQKLEEEEKNN
jgi:hypothetical protein